MSRSYMQTEKECFVCRHYYGEHNSYDLHLHHIYYGWGNRRVSDQEGAVIWLCADHHNMSDKGIHFDSNLDIAIKKMAQEKYEETHTREEFMQKFGRSYL